MRCGWWVLVVVVVVVVGNLFGGNEEQDKLIMIDNEIPVDDSAEPITEEDRKFNFKMGKLIYPSRDVRYLGAKEDVFDKYTEFSRHRIMAFVFWVRYDDFLLQDIQQLKFVSMEDDNVVTFKFPRAHAVRRDAGGKWEEYNERIIIDKKFNGNFAEDTIAFQMVEIQLDKGDKSHVLAKLIQHEGIQNMSVWTNFKGNKISIRNLRPSTTIFEMKINVCNHLVPHGVQVTINLLVKRD
ncbi:MAG: hypothetical protein Harvfovirus28_3 [Harvfovirus sp.]|uniref:Uncharacterized protein n=1 Tax=Harvfovirus sp. TaxID=2487768 RepID=A0A3G5A283_9VIRU|nr:MAG: hypothetical protein Harvfovirus28_3 [Harvfovirus sp.]